MYFSLFLPISTTKNLRHYIQIKLKTLKGREEKADWLGTSEHEEWYVGEFLGYSFYPIYPRFEAEDTSNLEMPMEADKKKINKGLFSLAKEPGKKQSSKN